MDLELISFKICPYVQRSVITLNYKSTPYKITHIDLAAPPAWFKTISPFGQVPLLRINENQVIFESAVINEFLDEITPGTLLPEEPIQRALDRSWIGFGSALIQDLSGVMHADTKEKFEQTIPQIKEKLRWLEQILADGPYFNGPDLSLTDFAYAPFFMRAELLGLGGQLYVENDCPKTTQWCNALLALPAVQNSVVKEFPDLIQEHIRKKAPYAASVLGLSN
jgi:glutathione S-transferase